MNHIDDALGSAGSLPKSLPSGIFESIKPLGAPATLWSGVREP